MGKYLHLFEGTASTEAHDELYNGSGYTEPWVAYIEDTDSMSWNKAHGVEYDACEYKEVLNFGNMKELRLEHFPELQVSFALIGSPASNGGPGGDDFISRGATDTLSNPCEILNYVTFFWSGNDDSGGDDVIDKKGALSKGGESDGFYYYVYPDGTQETMNTIDDVNNIINSVILPQLPNCEFFNWSDLNTMDTCFCMCGAKAVYDSNVDPGFAKTKLGEMPRESWGEYDVIVTDNIESLYESDGEGYTVFDITLVDSKNCTDAMTCNFRYNHLEETYEIYNGGWVDIGFSKLGDLMSEMPNTCYFYIGSSAQHNETLSGMTLATLNVLNNNIYILQQSPSNDDDNPVTPFDPGEMTIEN